MRTILAIAVAVTAIGSTARAAVHVDPPAPCVTITSEDPVDRATLDAYAATIRDALTSLATIAADDRRFCLDVSISSLRVELAAGTVTISTELHVVVSWEGGAMLSFVSGGAVTEVPRQRYRASMLPGLQRQAIGDACGGMIRRLRARMLRAVIERRREGTS